MQELSAGYGDNYGRKIDYGFSMGDLTSEPSETSISEITSLLQVKKEPPTYRNGKQVFIKAVEEDTEHAKLVKLREDMKETEEIIASLKKTN